MGRGSPSEAVHVSTATTFKLRDYQQVGVEYLRGRKRAALFWDMGLGKTATTLTALTDDMLPALVVAPKRVAEHVWPTEVPLWRPDLTVDVAAGDPLKRAGTLSGSPADIVTIGRDVLPTAVPHTGRFKTIILDELSSFKDRSTKRWKAAKKITAGKDYVWGLTGTPASNGLLDLWAQVYLLDRGERLGTALTQYRAGYFTPGRQLASGTIIDWNLIPGSDELIYRKIEDICMSLNTQGLVDLPPVTHNRLIVPLPAKARKVYQDMKQNYVADLKDFQTLASAALAEHTASSAGAMTVKLSQIAAGILYSDEFAGQDRTVTTLHTAKVDAVKEIMESNAGSPVLLFYQFQAERDMYLKAFPEAATPDTPDFVARWNRGELSILVAHPESIGHGLNLQHGGHTIVWASPTWSLEAYAQANKRLIRSGQEHPVVIHELIAQDTINAEVYDVLADKKTVEQALIDHLESPI